MDTPLDGDVSLRIGAIWTISSDGRTPVPFSIPRIIPDESHLSVTSERGNKTLRWARLGTSRGPVAVRTNMLLSGLTHGLPSAVYNQFTTTRICLSSLSHLNISFQ